jgi:Tol biopolymer transport system component
LQPRSSRRAIATLLVIPMIVLAACTDAPTEPFSPTNTANGIAAAKGGGTLPIPGRIVYTSQVTGDFEIYSMNPDGTDPRRLTSSPGLDLEPVVSPNGKKIAFVSFRTGALEIFTMNTDGSGVRQLTSLGGAAREPAWSPDGRRIAFAYGTAATGYDIHLMHASGSGVQRLTTDPSDDRHPTWSPDGKQIAFRSDRTGTPNIYIMQSDGSGVSPFTSCPLACIDPAWSPDGAHIAYAEVLDSGPLTAKVERVDHTRTIQLTTHDLDEGPSWSPDGTRLTYAAYVLCQFCPVTADIFTIAADGSGEQRLTTTFGDELTPSWGR